MAHGRSLRRKEQAIDSRLLHALELSLHRALQLFVADLKLGSGGLAKIGNLAAPVSLQLRRSRSVVGVGINNHNLFLLRPLKKTQLLRCTRSTRSNVPARVRLRSSISRSPRIWTFLSGLDNFSTWFLSVFSRQFLRFPSRLSVVMLSAIGRLILSIGDLKHARHTAT